VNLLLEYKHIIFLYSSNNIVPQKLLLYGAPQHTHTHTQISEQHTFNRRMI